MSDSDLRAAVAAGVLGAESAHRQLLQATVEVARAIFAAKASTIFLYDEETDELVFEASSGEGSSELLGHRIPSSTGIAGWTLVTRQPLVLTDVSADPRWGGQEIAERTGYAPKGLMSVPLLHGEEAVGVLQVLDRPEQDRFSLEEMELLGLFANQAAISIDLLRKARAAKSVMEDGSSDIASLARLAANLDSLEGERRQAASALLTSLETLFKD